MSYLSRAEREMLLHLGLYSTPAHILALGTASGKGKAPAAYIVSNPPFGGTAMIEMSRGDNSFQYRQREDEPCVIESRKNYRGAPWRFVKRYETQEEARMALLKMAKDAQEGKDSDEG